MLNEIQARLEARGLVRSTWAEDMRERGKEVALFREYYEGDHRMKLTAEMKKMMQISDSRLDRYNDNYCEIVVDTMADRLSVDKVVPVDGEEAAQDWARDVMIWNRFDGLQIEIHEAVLRDGETYVMAQYNDESEMVEFSQENAFDGEVGVIGIWDVTQTELVAGVKVWYEIGDLRRINIYYEDSVEKYAYGDGEFNLLETVDTTRGMFRLGVPLIAFLNKGKKGRSARSELKNVVPLQDSLNRTLVSMVMASELSAFAVLFAVGFDAPKGFTPGMVIEAKLSDGNGNMVVPESPEEASAYSSVLNAMRLERVESGSQDEYIKQAEWLIEQIYNVSNTPQEGAGDNSSGESLKQREVKLLAKVRRAQVQLGNAYEDLFDLGIRLQELYGARKPPMVTRWMARWKDAQVRNDAEYLVMFQALHAAGYEREALRVLSQSSIFDYDEQQIDEILAQRAADSAAAVERSLGNLPTFGEFQGG